MLPSAYPIAYPSLPYDGSTPLDPRPSFSPPCCLQTYCFCRTAAASPGGLHPLAGRPRAGPAQAMAGRADQGVGGVCNLPPTRPHSCCGHSPLPSLPLRPPMAAWGNSPLRSAPHCCGHSHHWSDLRGEPGWQPSIGVRERQGTEGEGERPEAGWGGRGTGRPDGNGWRPSSSPSLGLRKGAKGEGMCRDRRGGGEGGAARGGVGTGWQPSSGVREIDLGGRSRG